MPQPLPLDRVFDEVLQRLGRNDHQLDQLDKPRLVRFLKRNPEFSPGPGGAPQWVPVGGDKSGLDGRMLEDIALNSHSIPHAAMRVISFLTNGLDVVSDMTPAAQKRVFDEVEARMAKLSAQLIEHHQKVLEQEIAKTKSGKAPDLHPEELEPESSPQVYRSAKPRKKTAMSVQVEQNHETTELVKKFADERQIPYKTTATGKLHRLTFVSLWRQYQASLVTDKAAELVQAEAGAVS